MIGRLIASVFVLLAAWFANAAWSPQAMLTMGRMAGDQFKNDDTAFLNFFYTSQAISGVTAVIGIVAFIVLLLIWWGPIRRWVAAVTAAMVLLLMLGTPHGMAFFEQTDRTEAYTILPNQSAFWIPNAGNNKDQQAQLDSEAFLNQNKIAASLFIIPHFKFTGSGGTSILSGWDFYVPTGRLIVVDRTPYSREWVKSAHRGTSKSDESFPCQSVEGINVTVGVSIGTFVTQANAAKFLFNFGVKAPEGNPGDPKVIFTSVYYGRSLSEVMDDVVRKKVQTLICNEVTSRPLDKVNAEATKIITDVTKVVDEYLKGVGISLQFLGWADTFEFDHPIQDAINRRYVAEQDKVIATILAPHIDTIQAIAVAGATKAWGDKSDGKFPTTLVGYPPDLKGMLMELLRGLPVAPPAMQKQQ